jgi:hypothetical protein
VLHDERMNPQRLITLLFLIKEGKGNNNLGSLGIMQEEIKNIH